MGDRWCRYNPNPSNKSVGDCAVRACAKATGKDWEEVYMGLTIEGFCRCDLISANHVWGAYLSKHGFVRDPIDESCESCTVNDFAISHPDGVYVLALSGHVVCVASGMYYDSWDSGAENPLYYWHKKEDK